MKFLKFWKSNETLSKVAKKWSSYVLKWNTIEEQVFMMETRKNFLGSRLHNGDVKEFMRNKLP